MRPSHDQEGRQVDQEPLAGGAGARRGGDVTAGPRIELPRGIL